MSSTSTTMSLGNPVVQNLQRKVFSKQIKLECDVGKSEQDEEWKWYRGCINDLRDYHAWPLELGF